MGEAEPSKRPKSNWAQIASAVIALLGFVVVSFQVYYISRNFNIASARQVYMSYSETGLRHPEFVEPDLAKLKADPEKYVQYKNFVSHMLFAYDEIFAVYDDPEWHYSFNTDIKYHMQYICKDMNMADDETYFPKIRKVLKEAR